MKNHYIKAERKMTAGEVPDVLASGAEYSGNDRKLIFGKNCEYFKETSS
jgi:hypothetical protein